MAVLVHVLGLCHCFGPSFVLVVAMHTAVVPYLNRTYSCCYRNQAVAGLTDDVTPVLINHVGAWRRAGVSLVDATSFM